MQRALKLAVHDICKRYESVNVVESVSIAIEAGQVVGLIGENGAGKSTLLNILTGIVQADSGEMVLDGKAFRPANYAQAASRGVSRVFQEQALIPNLRIYENLLLSHEARFTHFGQIIQRRRMIELAQDIADKAELGIDVRRQTSDYSFSKRQLLEIARACVVPVRILGIAQPVILLDEPTASLDRADEDTFFRLVASMRHEASFVFVSHRLSEVLTISDAIVVMKDGRIVARLEAREANEKQLHGLMVGRERQADYYHESSQAVAGDQFALQARSLSGVGYRDVDIDLHKGEVLGVGGLLDSGKSEMGKGIVGVIPPWSGKVRLRQGDWHNPDMRHSLANGVGYIPAERLAEGIIPDFQMAWNMSLASGDLFSSRLGIWNSRQERDVAERMIVDLNVRGATPSSACSKLSGGNQQKVVLARWLCRSVSILVLDNPTRGVDAGAKEEIYAIIRGLTAKGVSIVLITDELLELIGMSNRIAIMQRGQVTAIVDAPPSAKPSEVEMIRLMLPTGDAIRPASAA